MSGSRREIGRKILLLLVGGLALGLSGSPRRYNFILRQIKREWRTIKYEELKNAIRNLYRSRLIDFRYNRDGSATLLLTGKGRTRALTYKLYGITIPQPKIWDKRWRLVMFDIPERLRKARDVLRWHLKQLGFVELQHSVFVHPFECQDQIDFIIEFYQLRRWVRYAIVETIDNNLHLQRKFRSLLDIT